jgi:uncharacterized protein YecT (DUF1311 family)
MLGSAFGANCSKVRDSSGCYFYEDNDSELNVEYKKILPLLDTPQATTLKKTQREWMKWRDSSCEEIVSNSGCTNSSCEEAGLYACLADITRSRVKEIKDFQKDIPNAMKTKFSYSTKILKRYSSVNSTKQ